MKSLITLIGLIAALAASVCAGSLGTLGMGITAKESASGTGYILFSPTDLTGRLTLYPNQATNFVAVYNQSGTWYYYNNETALSFTPVATDVLVASVDYTADTASLLVGQNTIIHGIHAGYGGGDLNIIVNQWNGVANPGEFTATGSFITLNLIPPTIVETPTGRALQWTGAPDHTYFIQYSTDLTEWSFFPEIEHGEVIFDYGFTTSSDRLFLRLKYTGIPTNDPENDDFDGDGLINIHEVILNLDPFKVDTDGDGTSDYFADTDADGLADGWEFKYFGGLGVADPNANPDGDGLTNTQESQLDTDPNKADTDGDGLSDYFELDLIGRWEFDDAGSGSVLKDTSTSDLDGDLATGSRLASGLSGGGVSLNATQQMKITPAPGQLNVGDNGSDFTVSFWIRLHANHEPGWNTILQKGDTDQKRTFHLSLKPDGQKLHARLTSDANVNEGIDTSVHSMVPEQWTHISYVHGGGQLKLYVNGQLDSTAAVGQSIANDDPFYIGKSAWLRGVNADFDEIMVHNRALSAAGILALKGRDSDGDGSSDILENLAGTDANDAQTGGSDDELTDSDGDGQYNFNDADHTDAVINWKKTSGPPQFAMIELDIANPNLVRLMDLSPNGSSLWQGGAENSYTFSGKDLETHGIPEWETLIGGQVGEFFGTVAETLFGDKMFGYLMVEGENGVSTQESLWDPVADTYTPFSIPTTSNPDDTHDSRAAFMVWNGLDFDPPFQEGLKTPFGWLPQGSGAEAAGSDANIEKNGNIVTQSSYWRYDEAAGTYGARLDLGLGAFEWSSVRSATLVQQWGDPAIEQRWNLVPTDTGLLVAEQGAGFNASALKPPPGESWRGVTRQGWAVTGQSLWVNGQWYDLTDLISGVTAVSLLDICDNGVAIAKVTKEGGGDKIAVLLPVEVVELSPKIKDEDGNDIAGSEKAKTIDAKPCNQMVKEIIPDTTTQIDTNKIAYRELKVKIGVALKGKKVTWSMEPLFVPEFDSNGPNLAPEFRGDWQLAAVSHRRKFELSQTYGTYEYKNLGTDQGETKIGDGGYTAIRVNVPPIGFNKARIKIQIEGINEEIKLIDLEVPGIVVIDAGHGTGETHSGSAVGGSTSPHSGEEEHAFAFDMATRMKASLKAKSEDQNLNLKIFLSRKDEVNISAPDRTKVARENGCDVYISIHFNPSSNQLHRDPFGMWDVTGNLNEPQDSELASSLRVHVQSAIDEIEPAESRNAARTEYNGQYWENNVGIQKGLDTCSDQQLVSGVLQPYNGNVQGYTPCRAALIEMEWMTHEKADSLFNMAPLKEPMRAAAAAALADAVIEDLNNHRD